MSGTYDIHKIGRLIEGNPYVGRGIVIGMTENGGSAATAYFIMGRSENSRNRVFIEESENLRTHPFDESKVIDPSLIIYYPLKRVGDRLIVTNGDQTDTITDYLEKGRGFTEALATREFEPDAPNFTPRISGMLSFGNGSFTYDMSILKSADTEGSACSRYTFSYTPIPGLGHFIHTYECDGNPLPTFRGEPERIFVPDSIDEFTDEIWNGLDVDNKLSLYVRYTDLATGKIQNRLINKNVK